MTIPLRLKASLLVLLVIAAACASTVATDSAADTAQTSEESAALPNDGEDGGASETGAMTETTLDEVIESMDVEGRMSDPEATAEAAEITLRDIPGAEPAVIQQIANSENFWTEAGGEIGLTYSPLETNRLFPRSVLETIDPVPCTFGNAPSTLDPEIARFNAFVAPCQEGLSVVWDDLELLPRIDARFPEAGVATLIAHEWGHIAQFQVVAANPSTILNEQQADCYAGAFVGWAEDRGVEPFVTPRARDLAIVSTLETRDRVGSDPASASAHGNGFDRVRAVQEGYEGGAAFCAGYADNPPPITQMVFQNENELANQGNLPFDEALTLLDPVVAGYFDNLTPETLSDFFVPPDLPTLQNLHAGIGDGAVATVLGLNYAMALQEASGNEVAGIEPALQRTCWFGTFLNAALTGAIPLTLSPGDLDETIMTLASSQSVISNPGLVFEMVAALRVGTVEGFSGCQLSR